MRTALLALAVTAIAVSGCRATYTGDARTIPSAQLADAHWVRAAPTAVVRQRELADCGLAALAMIGSAWGRTWTVEELRVKAPPRSGGIRLGTLRALARSGGLESYALRGEHADLARELASGRPVVLGLVLPFQGSRRASHYEVAVALDRRDGSVVTLDPATGKHRHRTRAALDAEWKPAGYAALFVVGELSRTASR